MKLVKNNATWETVPNEAGPSNVKPPSKRRLSLDSPNDDVHGSKKSKEKEDSEDPKISEEDKEGNGSDTDSSDVDWAVTNEDDKERKKKRKEHVRAQRNQAEESRRIRKLLKEGKTEEEIYGPEVEQNDPQGPIENVRLNSVTAKTACLEKLAYLDEEINRKLSNPKDTDSSEDERGQNTTGRRFTPSSPKDGDSTEEERNDEYTGDDDLFPDSQNTTDCLLDPETGVLVPFTQQGGKKANNNVDVDDSDSDDCGDVDFEPLTQTKSPIVRDMMKALLSSMKFAEDNGVSN